MGMTPRNAIENGAQVVENAIAAHDDNVTLIGGDLCLQTSAVACCDADPGTSKNGMAPASRLAGVTIETSRTHDYYPLVMTNIAMENHHFQER